MIRILATLLMGYIWTLVDLDGLFNYLLGMTTREYYLCWFIMGFIIWIHHLFVNRKDNQQ